MSEGKPAKLNIEKKLMACIELAQNRQDDIRALRDERDRLARAIVWALGYTDFRAREQGEGAYWWRTELRLRAKLTGEQIDAILAATTPAGQRASGSPPTRRRRQAQEEVRTLEEEAER